MAIASLSCVRQGQFRLLAAEAGTCEGACRHYLSCKEDESASAFESCMSECGDIFVADGEPDRDSLRIFEGLDCKTTVAFVDGNGDGRGATATGPRQKGRSRTR